MHHLFRRKTFLEATGFAKANYVEMKANYVEINAYNDPLTNFSKKFNSSIFKNFSSLLSRFKITTKNLTLKLRGIS